MKQRSGYVVETPAPRAWVAWAAKHGLNWTKIREWRENMRAEIVATRIEVRDGGLYLTCGHCKKMKALAEFGLRKMPDGTIRNQPWCGRCRSTESSARRLRAE